MSETAARRYSRELIAAKEILRPRTAAVGMETPGPRNMASKASNSSVPFLDKEPIEGRALGCVVVSHSQSDSTSLSNWISCDS